jgi:hypothetical protein
LETIGEDSITWLSGINPIPEKYKKRGLKVIE